MARLSKNLGWQCCVSGIVVLLLCYCVIVLLRCESSSDKQNKHQHHLHLPPAGDAGARMMVNN